MDGQSAWLVLAGIVFGGGGIGAAVIGARSLRKVEGIKNQTALFDALATNQNNALTRMAAEIDAKDKRISALEAEIALLEHQVRELHREHRKGTR